MHDGPVRGGNRGGQGDFRWDNVKNDKHRENYLGHTVNAPVGRWQANKDVHWYSRDTDESAEAEALRRREEIQKLKQQEEDAISAALGYVPVKRDDTAGTGANNIPVKGDLDRLEQEERKRDKELRKAKRAQKREERQLRREEKDARRHDGRSRHDDERSDRYRRGGDRRRRDDDDDRRRRYADDNGDRYRHRSDDRDAHRRRQDDLDDRRERSKRDDDDIEDASRSGHHDDRSGRWRTSERDRSGDRSGDRSREHGRRRQSRSSSPSAAHPSVTSPKKEPAVQPGGSWIHDDDE